jgi:hypothetical protein
MSTRGTTSAHKCGVQLCVFVGGLPSASCKISAPAWPFAHASGRAFRSYCTFTEVPWFALSSGTGFHAIVDGVRPAVVPQMIAVP